MGRHHRQRDPHILTAAYDGTRIDDLLPLERVMALSFVITANLLASHRQDDERWWDHFDRAEDTIEATLKTTPRP